MKRLISRNDGASWDRTPGAVPDSFAMQRAYLGRINVLPPMLSVTANCQREHGMERVEASIGVGPRPYRVKIDTDANYKRMVVLTSTRNIAAVQLGIASPILKSRLPSFCPSSRSLGWSPIRMLKAWPIINAVLYEWSTTAALHAPAVKRKFYSCHGYLVRRMTRTPVRRIFLGMLSKLKWMHRNGCTWKRSSCSPSIECSQLVNALDAVRTVFIHRSNPQHPATGANWRMSQTPISRFLKQLSLGSPLSTLGSIDVILVQYKYFIRGAVRLPGSGKLYDRRSIRPGGGGPISPGRRSGHGGTAECASNDPLAGKTGSKRPLRTPS